MNHSTKSLRSISSIFILNINLNFRFQYYAIKLSITFCLYTYLCPTCLCWVLVRLQSIEFLSMSLKTTIFPIPVSLIFSSVLVVNFSLPFVITIPLACILVSILCVACSLSILSSVCVVNFSMSFPIIPYACINSNITYWDDGNLINGDGCSLLELLSLDPVVPEEIYLVPSL